MVATIGLTGLRPAPEQVALVTAPPYDVIKKGSELEALLAARSQSLYHVTLGERPAEAFARLRSEAALIADDEPAYYVYEQRFGAESRTGVFVAAEVTPYAAKQIIRHEKTFDDKVKGRIALARATDHTFGPVFALTRAKIGAVLAKAKSDAPLYHFTTDLQALNDLHGIESRIWRVTQASELGREIQETLATQPFYIADGHHRYHAALLNPQTHALVYVTEEARIQAYDRVVNGVRRFADIRSALALRPTSTLHTPPKHTFCLYTRDGAYLLDAKSIPTDVVGRLDCSILERELYPQLGLTHSMIQDPKHFDYYPESQIDQMKAAVDRGEYDLAIALHPVSIDELVAVADAGLSNPDIVMPEKSTFFAPKILSGLFVYRHVMK
ncbi:DUF1015 family protein [Sandaracinus amylolyticus]|uniref:DUF1015 domain-containing protein n=1 Tax=Sandaracinus amylolyticus TaxID=927083 RepID=A0A0F6W218_9BACT|nr:DUF1015 family protein [Sandaracinus amylolyticus]AKF05302.1 hypothetical protein DB32_002451 [Sandaracinus amylolyticus]